MGSQIMGSNGDGEGGARGVRGQANRSEGGAHAGGASLPTKKAEVALREERGEGWDGSYCGDGLATTAALGPRDVAYERGESARCGHGDAPPTAAPSETAPADCVAEVHCTTAAASSGPAGSRVERMRPRRQRTSIVYRRRWQPAQQRYRRDPHVTMEQPPRQPRR